MKASCASARRSNNAGEPANESCGAFSAAMLAMRSIAYAVVKSLSWQVTAHELLMATQRCVQGR